MYFFKAKKASSGRSFTQYQFPESNVYPSSGTLFNKVIKLFLNTLIVPLILG